ncbi:HTH domain-containing protein [Niastella caeni]|uniref:HTH domain-containing protein n=1 Tax=Niastella caeni TaxID=2569763 RepID=A0A4V4H0V0_9BACT|nr:HTH domain-containing protein [Niastella caeni]THU38056.1 HTH domain-containing protein [Niastella caeni]
MKIYFYRISAIDQCIQSECTGDAQRLATHLGIARSTLFKYLNDMKELGAPIDYCRRRKTFYYKYKGFFMLHFRQR